MVAAEGDADRPIRFEVGHLDLGWHPLYESRGLLCVQCFRLTDIIREGPLQGHAPRRATIRSTSINDRRTSARIVSRLINFISSH